MPSTSPKQARFMAAIAHDPAFAAKAGVPQSVGEDFYAADQAKKPKYRNPKNKLLSKTDRNEM